MFEAFRQSKVIDGITPALRAESFCSAGSLKAHASIVNLAQTALDARESSERLEAVRQLGKVGLVAHLGVAISALGGALLDIDRDVKRFAVASLRNLLPMVPQGKILNSLQDDIERALSSEVEAPMIAHRDFRNELILLLAEIPGDRAAFFLDEIGRGMYGFKECSESFKGDGWPEQMKLAARLSAARVEIRRLSFQ